MQGLSDAGVKARNIRRKTLDILFDKYPKGFTIKNMLEDYPKIFTSRRQASDFLVLVKDSEGIIKLVRKGNSCFYLKQTDVYRLLNELWKTPSVALNEPRCALHGRALKSKGD